MSLPSEPDEFTPPRYPNVAVDGLYQDLRSRYLNEKEQAQCAKAAARALDPVQHDSARKELEALYRSAAGSELGEKSCSNYAEAWVLAAQAKKALDEGRQHDMMKFKEAAYKLLVSNNSNLERSSRRTDKSAAQEACINTFCEEMRTMRPANGWRDHSSAAEILAPVLASIIEKKSREYDGVLWKKDPAALILEWLDNGKGPVYEAYRGR